MELINDGIEEALCNHLALAMLHTPFYQLIGVRASRMGAGYIELMVDLANKHTNPIGAVHGGLYMTVADSAMANAVRTLGINGLTVECSTSLLAGAQVGDVITARGVVERAGKKLIFASAKVMTGDKLLAISKGTFYRAGLIDIEHGGE